jgi:hypothetical protein
MVADAHARITPYRAQTKPCALHPQSPALRLEYAKANAEVCKVAKQGTVRRYVDRLRALYDSGDDALSYVSAYAFNCLATSCHDKLQRYMSELAPMAFMVRPSVCYWSVKRSSC